MNGIASILSSGIGMSKRSRNCFSASTVIFFAWCAIIWPSPDSPMPKPFTVLARITVGWSLCFTAAA